MAKKIKEFSAVIFSLLFCATQAQITYTSSDFGSTGDSIHVSHAVQNLSAQNFTATGAGTAWDFSSITATTQEDIKYIDPNDGGYKNSWCLSNAIVIGCNTQFNNFTNIGERAIESQVIGPVTFQNIVHHYQNDNNYFKNVMFGATVEKAGVPIAVPISYEQPDTIYQFPLSYGNQSSSSYRFAIDLNSVGITFRNAVQGIRTINVEGWGSLTTPYKSYPEVIKVKSLQYRTDSLVTSQGTVVVKDTTVTFSWFAKSVSIPVFEVKGNLVNGEYVYTKAQYEDTLLCTKPRAFYTYSPVIPNYDTTTFSCSVSFGNLSASSDSLFWDFGDGTTSTATNPSHTFKCPGTQQVKLVAVNRICQPYQADTTLIPVYIADSTNYFNKTSSISSCGDSVLINGEYQKTSGVYSKTYPSANGCDSVVTVTLTVTNLDLSVTNVLNNLIASEVNADYQWLDCNDGKNPISGETGLSYKATSDGNYAVAISKNACTDTSVCSNVIITSIEQINQNVQVYPNPSEDMLNVKGENFNAYTIINSLGVVVQQNKTLSVSNAIINLESMKPGIYTLVLLHDSKVSYRAKFVKK